MNEPHSPWSGKGVFSDVRVVELGGIETIYAGKLLADQGAEVILVEPPEGHPSRRLPPYTPDHLDDRSSVTFAYHNGNKRSVSIDVASQPGSAALAKLLGSADVVLAGGRPADLRAIGVEPEDYADGSSGRVLATITPFGWTGPYADFAADDIVLQALGGMMNLGGYVDGRPLRPPALQSYIGAGCFTAIAVAAALLARDSNGLGQHIDVSAQECVVMGLENAIQFYDMEGVVRSRHGGRQVQVGRGIYECSDGYIYLMLGLHAGSHFWSTFLRWLEVEGAEGRERLAGDGWTRREYIESDEAKATFNSVFETFTRSRTKSQLYASARAHGIPLAPVNDLNDVRKDEQLRYRKFFVDVDATDWSHGPAVAPGPPYRMTQTPWVGRYAPRRLGEDNAILDEDRPRQPRPGTPPNDAGHNDQPLAGVRVVDFSWVGAGPYCTRILADLGADVVKIESGKRVDQIRVSPPFRDGIPGVNRSGYFADRNAGKRSICINLKHPEGREAALSLIEAANVVVSSFAPGTMARLGLDYDAVRARNESAIYVEMSMQGSDGPHAGHIGYGLTIGALAGLQHLVGEEGRPPTGTGTNYPDHIPSPGHAAFAIVAALRYQRATGIGQRIELSQTEATLAAIGAAVMAESVGIPQAPADNVQPGALLHDAFRTSDPSRWIAISVDRDEHWHRLLHILGLPSTIDPHWASGTTGSQRRLLRNWIETATTRFDASELMRALQAESIRAGVVQNARDLVEEDPQLRHRDHWVRLTHAEMGHCLYNAMPMRFSRARITPRSGAPLLGEHTRDVFAAAGWTEQQIAAKIAEGVLV